MKKLALAALFAAMGTVAAPVSVASAEEPIVCKIVNGLGGKLINDDQLVYCIDDPNDPGSPF